MVNHTSFYIEISKHSSSLYLFFFCFFQTGQGDETRQRIVHHQNCILVDRILGPAAIQSSEKRKEAFKLCHRVFLSVCIQKGGKQTISMAVAIMARHWMLVLVLLAGTARSLVHPKMSYLFSSADSDDLASSWLTSDTAAVRPSDESDDVIPQSDQRWIKPSPKGRLSRLIVSSYLYVTVSPLTAVNHQSMDYYRLIHLHVLRRLVMVFLEMFLTHDLLKCAIGVTVDVSFFVRSNTFNTVRYSIG